MTTPGISPLDTLDIKKRLDRLQSDVDFIKNHMSSYLGNGTGLTHLIDETPIYINTDDFGCPANFINGGRYEEEYYAVLASFRKPDSIFLDIGANLGVFSLRLAPLIRKGKALAFEPNNTIRELFKRSVHLNGWKDLITVFEYGVSDQDQRLVLAVPEGHAGGASLQPAGSKGVEIEVRRLDELLFNMGHFDIAKIDVEGHELEALRGMTRLLRQSPGAVVLFEKLVAHSGIEADIVQLFATAEMAVYRVDGLTLTKVNLAQFADSEAYFLAARPSTIGNDFERNFLRIYPDDLHVIEGSVLQDRLVIESSVPEGALLFHGPYWFLPRGAYTMHVDADIEGEVSIAATEKFGYPVQEFVVSGPSRSFDFIVDRDLTHFEIVGRSAGEYARIRLDNICLTRRG